MICQFCDHPVTKQQLDRNEATTTGRDKYAHLVCIDNHTAGTPVIDDRIAVRTANTPACQADRCR